MTCPHAHDDAAYVLGALSAAERRDYEEHLADCASCTRAVTDLAGLPGLLGRVDAETLSEPTDPVPDTLLPALLGEVRRSGRRRTLVTAGLAAAAAVVVAVGAIGVVDGLGGPADRSSSSTTSATPPEPSGAPMVAVGAAPLRATVALRRTPWGTRLDMTCTYRPGPGAYPDSQADSYVLVVRTDNGRTERVASWRAVPGQPMQVTGSTALGRDRIASVAVRTASGVPVLRLRT